MLDLPANLLNAVKNSGVTRKMKFGTHKLGYFPGLKPGVTTNIVSRHACVLIVQKAFPWITAVHLHRSDAYRKRLCLLNRCLRSTLLFWPRKPSPSSLLNKTLTVLPSYTRTTYVKLLLSAERVCFSLSHCASFIFANCFPFSAHNNGSIFQPTCGQPS